MKTFREWLDERELNEANITPSQISRYLVILKKNFNSDKMELNIENNILEVEFDTVSVYFKEGYLVGFKDEEGYYEVSKKLKSIKEINNIKSLSNFFGKKVTEPKQMEIPSEPVLTYFPGEKRDLLALIKELIRVRGDNANLNDIDVSKISDMNYLFQKSSFNGDISKWDTSNVDGMTGMFRDSKFNGDISKWNISYVTAMNFMFYKTPFNGDISKWDVGYVEDMDYMFADSKFSRDISKWDVSRLKHKHETFRGSALEKNPPAWYKG